MRNLLFVSFDIDTCNSSSAIRNRRLVHELKSQFNIYILDFMTSNGITNSLSANKTSVQLNTINATNIKKICATKKTSWLHGVSRSYLRSFVPDKYTLKLLFIDFSMIKLPNVKFDVVITSSDPKSLHLLYKNKTFFEYLNQSKPVRIQYWGDPWYDDINFYTNSLTKFLEGWILNSADLIIYNSRATLDFQKYIFEKHAHKMQFLSRGIPNEAKVLPDGKSFKFNSPRFIYAGDYSKQNRDINPFIKAVDCFEYKLTIIGNGDITESSNNIEVVPRIRPDELNSYFEEADVLVVIMNRKGTQMPGKLYDYMALEKPIIVLHEGFIPPEFEVFSGRLIIIKNDFKSITAFLGTCCNINVNFSCIKSDVFEYEVAKFNFTTCSNTDTCKL